MDSENQPKKLLSVLATRAALRELVGIEFTRFRVEAMLKNGELKGIELGGKRFIYLHTIYDLARKILAEGS